MQQTFDYLRAFSRNIGWVTPEEQLVLAKKRIAIAGMGGVGGVHFITLVRLGITDFHVADYDVFDLVNFNRQAGATMSTLGKAKAHVMTELAREINPDIKVKIFDNGVNPHVMGEFLQGVDLYVDGLDFFAFEARESTFRACATLGIPAITVAPLGMGGALLNFLPGKMTFEEYFCLDGYSDDEKAVRFLVGLAPSLLQRTYLVQTSAVDLMEHRGPSTAMACQLCAGVAATEALKILLRRGKVLSAPWGVHFDAYRNKLKRTWRPLGNRNPIQRVAISMSKLILYKRKSPKYLDERKRN